MRLHSFKFDELIAHGVDRRFARILSDPDSYHRNLNILIGKTNWDYFIPKGVTDVVPLWDSNADSYLRWNHNGLTEYVRLFYDDPNWSFIAKSEQGVMAKLWQDWIEFQESDEECRRFADAIGFHYSDEAFALLESDYDAFKDWMQELTENTAQQLIQPDTEYGAG